MVRLELTRPSILRYPVMSSWERLGMALSRCKSPYLTPPFTQWVCQWISLFYLILRLRAVISLLHDARRGYIPGIKLRKMFSLQATLVRWLGIEPSWMVFRTKMDFVVFVKSTLKNISTCVSLRPCIAIVVQTGLEPARALNAPNKDVYQFHHCTPGTTDCRLHHWPFSCSDLLHCWSILIVVRTVVSTAFCFIYNSQ